LDLLIARIDVCKQGHRILLAAMGDNAVQGFRNAADAVIDGQLEAKVV
jgi:hypothetical protein